MKLQDIVKQTMRFQDNDELFIAEFNNGFHVVYEQNEERVKYALLPLYRSFGGGISNYAGCHGNNLVTDKRKKVAEENWKKVQDYFREKKFVLQKLDDKTLDIYDQLKDHLGVRKIEGRDWSEIGSGLGLAVSVPIVKPFLLAWRGLQRLTGVNYEANIYDVPLMYAPILFGSSLYQLVVPTQKYFNKIKNKKLLHKKPQSNTDVAINFTLGCNTPNKFLGMEFILPDGNEVFHWHVYNQDERCGKGERYRTAKLYFTTTQEVIDGVSNLLAEKTKLEKDHKDFEEQLKSANHEEFLKSEKFLD